MPGVGRPADPLWVGIGISLGVIPGIYFHQLSAGLGIGVALGIAFGLIREDMKRGKGSPVDPLWFVIALAIGLLAGLWLHHLGLNWPLGIALGLVFGAVLGAVSGTIRADRRRKSDRRS